jgi:hypothetical protein
MCVDSPLVREKWQQELDEAYQDYRSAAAAWRAAATARTRAAYVDDSAERLVRARVRVYDVLTASGWQAPPEVRAQLERDRALVAVPTDLDALLASAA